MAHPLLAPRVVRFCRLISEPLARFSLFVVFFWFGLLKVLGLSPASQLVYQLFERTLSFLDFNIFYLFFALLECAIGIAFLIRGLEWLVLPVLLVHMATTFLPLVLLPSAVWTAFMVP